MITTHTQRVNKALELMKHAVENAILDIDVFLQRCIGCQWEIEKPLKQKSEDEYFILKYVRKSELGKVYIMGISGELDYDFEAKEISPENLATIADMMVNPKRTI